MRMWADVRNGQLQGGTADLALTGVQAGLLLTFARWNSIAFRAG